MDLQSLAMLGALAGLIVLVLILLLRRPVADPALAQRLADLQGAQDAQRDRLAVLPAEFERALAREASAIGDRVGAASLDQTKALGEGISRIADRLAGDSAALKATLGAQDTALVERLALDALATREAMAEQRAQVVKALADHRDDMGLLRRDVTQGIGDIRTAFAEGLTKLQETLVIETTRARDLLDLKLTELRESNEQRLGDMQKTVNEQLASAVEKQMNESFSRVIDQFAAVQKAMGDVQAVTTQIVDIKRLFSNVKTRGGWGEAQVKAVLDDILPAGSYETNHKLSEDSAEAVEFAIRMPSEGGRKVFLAVDAKFPSEDYERLLLAADAGDAEGERTARRALELRVRAEAAKIATKYIRPPVTVEFAVLYLPTEGLYAEIARIPGAMEEIGRQQRVLILGPSLLPAMLRTIQMGHVTIALSEKADMVRSLLGATKAEMVRMDEVLTRLGKTAGTMANVIETARVRTRAVARKLRDVEVVDGPRAAELLELTAPGAENDEDAAS